MVKGQVQVVDIGKVASSNLHPLVEAIGNHNSLD